MMKTKNIKLNIDTKTNYVKDKEKFILLIKQLKECLNKMNLFSRFNVKILISSIFRKNKKPKKII